MFADDIALINFEVNLDKLKQIVENDLCYIYN